MSDIVMSDIVMSDIVGLVVAYAMIALVIAVAGLLLRARVFTPSLSRKFIHISVSHWWLLAMHFHTAWHWAAIGPVTFIVFNYLAYRTHLLSAMEDPVHRNNLGTVWFPVSLLLMVLLTFAGPIPLYVGGIGILTMGYGDGLASIVGKRWGDARPISLFGGTKSLAGSLTMFIASALVVALFMLQYHPAGGQLPGINARVAVGQLLGAAAATAAVAAAVELATPHGLDNITVPLSTALFFYAVFV